MVSLKELVQNNIKFSNADFDNVHDQCMKYLQTFGFDEHYQLTECGQIAQKIIDKIFDSKKIQINNLKDENQYPIRSTRLYSILV